MNVKKIFLILIISLILLMACQTTRIIEIYPPIIHPDIPADPEPSQWYVRPVEGTDNFLVEKQDLVNIGNYIIDMQAYAEELQEIIKYYRNATTWPNE